MDTHGQPDLQSLLRRTLAELGNVRLAILFGSQATGHAKPHSDLGLAVKMSAPLSAEHKIELIEKLAQVTGLPIDLIDLNSAGEPLPSQVLKHGIRLLGSDTDYAALLNRHLLDAADFLPYRNRILAERRLSWIGR